MEVYKKKKIELFVTDKGCYTLLDMLGGHVSK